MHRAQRLIPATCSPAKPIDKESDGEGAEDASDREDGHRDGPDGREGGLGDLLLVAPEPRLVDKVLNHLTHTDKNNKKQSTKTNGWSRQLLITAIKKNTEGI